MCGVYLGAVEPGFLDPERTIREAPYDVLDLPGGEGPWFLLQYWAGKARGSYALRGSVVVEDLPSRVGQLSDYHATVAVSVHGIRNGGDIIDEGVIVYSCLL